MPPGSVSGPLAARSSRRQTCRRRCRAHSSHHPDARRAALATPHPHGTRDRLMLLSTLSSLLERVPTKSVRLVVFNLDQQKELYRQDNFKLDAFDQVAQSIEQIELGLSGCPGAAESRWSHGAAHRPGQSRSWPSPQPADVVVFLGPMSRYFDRIPESWLEKPGSGGAAVLLPAIPLAVLPPCRRLFPTPSTPRFPACVEKP